MINKITELVKDYEKISAYKIVEKQKNGLEWYFIGNKVDTKRVIKNTKTDLVIYVDGFNENNERTRSSYTTTIHQSSTSEEIKDAIERAVSVASKMNNPWYPIPSHETAQNENTIPHSSFENMSLEKSMQKIVTALYNSETEVSKVEKCIDTKAHINSLELFITENNIHIVNSLGVDVSWKAYSGYCEYVVCAKAIDKEEVELFDRINFSELDEKYLCSCITERLLQCADRANAIQTPTLENMPIIFRGELAAEICKYWQNACYAQSSFEKTTAFKKDDFVTPENSEGSTINLSAIHYVKGNPSSRPYDEDGVALSSVSCIKDSKIVSFFGPTKYTFYIGAETSGNLPLCRIEGGKLSASELEKMDHVEGVVFSDFRADSQNGEFGAELRLGYLVKDGKKTAISGGSISGSIVDNKGKIQLSKELCVSSIGETPLLCFIPIATIAGN